MYDRLNVNDGQRTTVAVIYMIFIQDFIIRMIYRDCY